MPRPDCQQKGHRFPKPPWNRMSQASGVKMDSWWKRKSHPKQSAMRTGVCWAAGCFPLWGTGRPWPWRGHTTDALYESCRPPETQPVWLSCDLKLQPSSRSTALLWQQERRAVSERGRKKTWWGKGKEMIRKPMTWESVSASHILDLQLPHQPCQAVRILMWH